MGVHECSLNPIAELIVVDPATALYAVQDVGVHECYCVGVHECLIAESAEIAAFVNTVLGGLILWNANQQTQPKQQPQTQSPQTSSDPALQQEIEKEANAREYHARCNEPPPPGLDPCERAKWNLKKAQDCKAMRIANTNRWWGGVDDRHDAQLFSDLDNWIANAQDAVDRLCKCK